jgi:hypothetical protein
MRINGNAAICQRNNLSALKAYFAAALDCMKPAALDKPQKRYAMTVKKRRRLTNRHHG